ALVAEGAGQRMRGVRVSLTKPDANDQVYLEEDKLEIVKNALDEIATAIQFPGVHPTYMGAQAFWMGWGPPKYALIAQYYFGDAATAHSTTAGCAKIAFSTSIDEIFSPPLMMMSFLRSTMWM